MNTSDEVREQVVKRAQESVAIGEPMAWFEELYSSAHGDNSKIPWADGIANPYLVSWFEKTGTEGNGRSAVVVGCGLGEDAEELSKRGFTVTAFDLSPTAIEWCKKLYPKTTVHYLAANLFDLSEELTKGFDFIYECYTIQALPRSIRNKTIEAIASLLNVGGEMLLLGRSWQNEKVDVGPPWALKEEELRHFNTLGILEITSEEFWDDKTGYDRVRKLYRRNT